MLLVLALLTAPAAAQDDHAAGPNHTDYIARLNQTPDPERLSAWHDLLASEPHIAGTEGDWRVIDALAASFTDMGLQVDVHEFWPLLSYPVSAEVEILHPDIEPGAGLLPVREMALTQDPFTDDPGLTIGFNAYAASGEAIGEVVFANHGRKEDFERLRELGIDCTGKIVLAKYGGNYRGFKVKFAEEAGAAGLLIYLDPGDTGYVRGTEYPDGGWQTASCIQRGSIVTLPYKGDPLTPFVEATEDAERLDPDEAGLPTIPVQPIGWGAARQIIVRMRGPEAPQDWRGGLPMSYPLTGGPDLRVRVNVQQERKIAKTANVIARIEGATYPDQWVILGCHHDAWGHGAGDAMSGMISMMESARSFAEAAAAGHPPERTVIFAAWGAEEYGIIGSSEWVEANADELREKAVAYINLDMASMGPNFGASASPSLRRLVADAARDVPQAREPEISVLEHWVSRAPRADDPTRPRIGDLGGGSDHVGFVCHLGVPGVALSAGGSAGSSYHTAYDNLAWYRRVVGDDYEPALMIARMANAVAGRLASGPDASVDPSGPAAFIADKLRDMHADATLREAVGAEGLDALIALAERVAAMRQVRASLDPRWQREGFIAPAGLAGRPWYRNLLVASDPDSGYGAFPLPAVAAAIRDGDAEAARRALQVLQEELQAALE